MFSALLRLATIFALLAMPVGMASAPAVAMTGADRATTIEHCPDNPSDHEAPSEVAMNCKAACTALPASLRPPLPDEAPRPELPRATASTVTFEDNIPEIATPPPRRG